jgi:hypothetical protein
MILELIEDDPRFSIGVAIGIAGVGAAKLQQKDFVLETLD